MSYPVLVPRKYSGQNIAPEPVKGRCLAATETRWSTHQCKRADGHGPQLMFCKQHADKAELEGWHYVE